MINRVLGDRDSVVGEWYTLLPAVRLDTSASVGTVWFVVICFFVFRDWLFVSDYLGGKKSFTR